MWKLLIELIIIIGIAEDIIPKSSTHKKESRNIVFWKKEDTYLYSA